MSEPRTLIFDIETAPNIAFSWGPMYETSLIDLVKSWHLICYSYRWLGKGKTRVVALPDFPSYKKDKSDDRALCKSLWALLDEADIVICHNANFDVKKSFARFIHHGLSPPSPFKQYCTLKESKRAFAFTSNRLNDIARYLLSSRKRAHSGWDTWRKVLAGDEKQWRIMKRYCAHDTDLCYRYFKKLRLWTPTFDRLVARIQREKAKK